MKHIKILTFAVIAALTLFSCKKDEPDPVPPPVEVAENTYAGKLTVINNGNQEVSDVDIQLIKTEKEDSIMLFFHQVKFVQTMPNGFDIKIPVTSSSPTYPTTLSGSGITPYIVQGVGDMPFQNFRVDNMQGLVNNDSLKVSMNFVVVIPMGSLAQGDVYPTRFEGKIKE
jgi:hypothetical protein